MKQITKKLRPTGGFSHVLHLLLTIVLPIAVYVLIRLNLVPLAVIVVLVSKWRIFSVRPRYWLPLIRANAVDIIFALSTIIFMINTSSGLIQMIWAVAFALWLVLIKPSSSVFGISMQAFIAMIYGLVAVYVEWGGSTAVVIMLMTWLVAYSTAQHFLSSFDETHNNFLAHAWALFSASLAWLLSHDLLYFQVFSQVTLLLVILGFGLATLYYLNKIDKLSRVVKAELLFMMIVVVILNLIVLIVKGSGSIV